MKRFIAIFTLISLLFVLKPVVAAAQNYPFKSGEKVSVVVHYKFGFSADIAQIDLTTNQVANDGNPYYHVVANAYTYKGFDNFFKLKDLYESKFYVKDLSPLYFHRDVQEGKYWAKNWYDWKNEGKTLHAIVDKRNRPHRDTLYNADSKIIDILNLFFTARSYDFNALEKGKDFVSLVAIDKDIVSIRLHYICREQKKLSELGTFKAIKVGVEVHPVTAPDQEDIDANTSLIKFNGNDVDVTSDDGFYGKDKIFIWFSDDANKIPLYFSSPVAVGSINGRLSAYQGLKYPMSSKIK